MTTSPSVPPIQPPSVVHLRLDSTNLSLIPTALLMELFRVHTCFKMGLLVWRHEGAEAAGPPPDVAPASPGAEDPPEEQVLSDTGPVVTMGDAWAPPGFEPAGNLVPPSAPAAVEKTP